MLVNEPTTTRNHLIGAGAIFVAFVLIGNGMSPAAEAASPAEALAALRATGGTFATLPTTLELLGFVAFGFFVAELTRRLREHDHSALPWVVAIAGSIVLSVKLASGAPLWVLDSQLGTVSASTAELLLALNDGAFYLSWLPQGMMVGTAAWSAKRARLLPTWIAAWGVGAGALCIVGTIVGGAGPTVLGFLLSLLWILTTSTLLLARGLRRGARSSSARLAVEV